MVQKNRSNRKVSFFKRILSCGCLKENEQPWKNRGHRLGSQVDHHHYQQPMSPIVNVAGRANELQNKARPLIVNVAGRMNEQPKQPRSVVIDVPSNKSHVYSAQNVLDPFLKKNRLKEFERISSRLRTGEKKRLFYFAFNARVAENQHSKHFLSGDENFNLYAYQSGTNLKMLIYLKKISPESFKNGFTLRLLGTKEDLRHTENKFTQVTDGYIDLFIMPWDRFINRANGFIDKDENAVVEFDFTAFSFTDQLDGDKLLEFKPNALLTIENHSIMVNKELLSSRSIFFSNYFKGDIDEKMFGVAIENVGIAEFAYFLNAIYETKDHKDYTCITRTNLESIVRLAKRFEVQDVVKRCEIFMVDNLSTEKYLVLARKYNLNNLLNACVRHK